MLKIMPSKEFSVWELHYGDPKTNKSQAAKPSFYLREFGLQSTVIAAPVRGVPLALAAVLLSGPPGVHFAQTLCFSKFNT